MSSQLLDSCWRGARRCACGVGWCSNGAHEADTAPEANKRTTRGDRRRLSAGAAAFAPMIVFVDGQQGQQERLSYLITYIGDHDEAQTRLARVLALFHTTPILRAAQLPAPVCDHIDTLTVQLRKTSHDERNHIWTALGRPARRSPKTREVAPNQAVRPRRPSAN